MLQVTDNIEASCVFYVKVDTCTNLEQSKICNLTVNKFGIVKLIVRHDFSVGVSVMKYPGGYSRQSSAEALPLEQNPIDTRQLCDLEYHTP